MVSMISDSTTAGNSFGTREGLLGCITRTLGAGGGGGEGRGGGGTRTTYSHPAPPLAPDLSVSGLGVTRKRAPARLACLRQFPL